MSLIHVPIRLASAPNLLFIIHIFNFQHPFTKFDVYIDLRGSAPGEVVLIYEYLQRVYNL